MPKKLILAIWLFLALPAAMLAAAELALDEDFESAKYPLDTEPDTQRSPLDWNKVLNQASGYNDNQCTATIKAGVGLLNSKCLEMWDVRTSSSSTSSQIYFGESNSMGTRGYQGAQLDDKGTPETTDDAWIETFAGVRKGRLQVDVFPTTAIVRLPSVNKTVLNCEIGLSAAASSFRAGGWMMFGIDGSPAGANLVYFEYPSDFNGFKTRMSSGIDPSVPIEGSHWYRWTIEWDTLDVGGAPSNSATVVSVVKDPDTGNPREIIQTPFTAARASSFKPGVQAVYFNTYLGNSSSGDFLVDNLKVWDLAPAPAPEFSVSAATVAVGQTVTFTDRSTNAPNRWEWDFQNDWTDDSTEQNPSFVYSAPGTYTVKLAAFNDNGGGLLRKTACITVTASANRTVTFAADNTPGASLLNGGPQTVAIGADCAPVTAVAPAQYHFVEWTKGGAHYSSANPLTVVNVTEDMDLVAAFAMNQYDVTFVTDGRAGATIEGDTFQTVDAGGACSAVTAVAPAGCRFGRWVKNGQLLSTLNPLTLTGVTEPMTVMAVFGPIVSTGVRNWDLYE